MWWKNWLINRLGSLVIVAGPRQARFFHGPNECIIFSNTIFNSAIHLCSQKSKKPLDRKKIESGGLECKLMLMFCVGIVHTNLYDCIS